MNTNINDFETYLMTHVGSAGTVKVYKDWVEKWLATIDNSSPTEEDVQEYINSLKERGKISNSTITIIGCSIIKWFKFNKIKIELELPTVTLAPPEYLTLDEVNRAIEISPNKLVRVLIIVQFDTAVRISELINLLVENIDFKARTLKVTRKGGRETLVNISDRAINELSDWLETRTIDSERVFGDLSYQSVRLLYKEVGKLIGKDFHTHMLRHGRAIQMLNAGVEMNIVQQHLAHLHLSTTSDIYGQFTTADLKKKIPAW